MKKRMSQFEAFEQDIAVNSCPAAFVDNAMPLRK